MRDDDGTLESAKRTAPFMEVTNMDKKTLQELVGWLYSEKEDLTKELFNTTTGIGDNRRIGHLDMIMYFINVLNDKISKLEEP